MPARSRLLQAPRHDRKLPVLVQRDGDAIAGIGWKLQRLIDRGSLTSTLGAYLTGVAVTSAPWLLTTAVLVFLRLAARGAHTAESLLVEQTVTVIYALTVVLNAPLDVVVSRFAADRLYDHRLDAIGAPLRRALSVTLLGFAGVGTLVMLFLRVPLAIAVPGTVLTAIVGAQWLMLSVGGGLSSPGVVLRAFGFGAPLSILAALGFQRGLELGAGGYLSGFALGQLLTLTLLIVGVGRALPAASDESARLGPALVEYKLLAASSFAYHLSIWADKLILWLVAGREVAALCTAAAALAWFSVIPSFAWVYVQIETAFYRRYRAFYDALEGGGTLSELEQLSGHVRAEAFRILGGAAMVQFAVTALAFLGAPLVMRLAGLPPEGVPLFQVALCGAALQLMTLLALLLLYYFDLRREALAVSLVLLGSDVALTLVCHGAGLTPGLGYALACGLAFVLALLLVLRRLRTLLVDTFQSQPFGAI